MSAFAAIRDIWKIFNIFNISNKSSRENRRALLVHELEFSVEFLPLLHQMLLLDSTVPLNNLNENATYILTYRYQSSR